MLGEGYWDWYVLKEQFPWDITSICFCCCCCCLSVNFERLIIIYSRFTRKKKEEREDAKFTATQPCHLTNPSFITAPRSLLTVLLIPIGKTILFASVEFKSIETTPTRDESMLPTVIHIYPAFAICRSNNEERGGPQEALMITHKKTSQEKASSHVALHACCSFQYSPAGGWSMIAHDSSNLVLGWNFGHLSLPWQEHNRWPCYLMDATCLLPHSFQSSSMRTARGRFGWSLLGLQ